MLPERHANLKWSLNRGPPAIFAAAYHGSQAKVRAKTGTGGLIGRGFDG